VFLANKVFPATMVEAVVSVSEPVCPDQEGPHASSKRGGFSKRLEHHIQDLDDEELNKLRQQWVDKNEPDREPTIEEFIMILERKARASAFVSAKKLF
jgi:hypothetical protein